MQPALPSTWIPNKWIAVLIALLVPPFAFLYVARPRWALVYLVTTVAASVIDAATTTFVGGWPIYLSGAAALLLALIAAAHVFRIAQRFTPVTRRPWYSRWYVAAAPIVFLATAFFVRSFLYEPFRMRSVSMEPAIPAGAFIVAKKWKYGHYGAYGITFPHFKTSAPVTRGDLVVLRFPQDRSLTYVKRVVRLPGDRIEYRQQRLFVNGTAITPPADDARGRYRLLTETLDGQSYRVRLKPGMHSKKFTLDVPNDALFVMGDNRDHSNDSRYWGPLPLDDLRGKVVYVWGR